MRVALIQSPAVMGDVEKNYKIASSLIEEASTFGVEVFVFPEMSLTGYFDKKDQMKHSIGLNNEYVKKMINLSADGKTIIFGLSEKRGKDYFVTQVVAQNGEMVGTYKKHNLAGDEAKNYKKSKDTPVFNAGYLRFGITICADIDLDSLYKIYKKKGCKIVFECATPDLYGDSENRNWSKGYNWWRNNCIEKIGKYSKDNGMKIAVATMSGRNEYGDFPGGGYLFSENGEIIKETKSYDEELLIIDI